MYPGLLGPAAGFAGFEFEFRHSFYWVTGRQDFGVAGVELVGCRGGAREIPVAFLVEAVGEGFDGVCQNAVVVGDDKSEARFDCIELS